MPFFHDLTTELGLQLAADATRKAITTSIHLAPYQSVIAENASLIASLHPHLTPGITMSLANAGYGPHDSITEAASSLAAQRKIQNGIGWNSIGDKVNPSHAGLLSIPNIHFPEAIGTTLSKAAHYVNTAIESTADAISAPVKPTLRIIGAAAFSVPQLADAAVRRVATNSKDNSLKNELLETTLGQSVKSLVSGHGLALGQGYMPEGRAARLASESASQTQSLTYADHPFFSLHDDPNTPVSPHAGTTGRNITKLILEPGSPLFSAVSGLIDAAKTIALDPVSAAGKAAGKSIEARKIFSAEDLGKSAPSLRTTIDPFVDLEGYQAEAMKIAALRKTIDPVHTENWLTQSPAGRALVEHYAGNSSAYDIWRRSGGLNGNMTPDLAAKLAATRTPEEVRGVLSPVLGIDLLNKPITTGVSPVGGVMSELGIRDRLDGIRLLNNVPSFSAIDLEDHAQTAKELVLNLRNAKAPQSLIESSFNEMAAASTPVERANILHNTLNIDLPRHIVATDLDGPLGSLDRNFQRLRSAFDDEAAWTQITRDQIARKQPIMGLIADGEEQALRSPYHDAEAVNRFFTAPDIRTIRRVTSTYGRLLVLSHAEVPLAVLDHIQDIWRGSNIARVSTMLRIVGQSQVQMTARGLDSPYRHLFDYIAEASGRKLGTNILGEELSSAAVHGFTSDARNVATTSWANDVRQAQREIVPFYDSRFATSLANDIYDLHVDPLARRVAGRFDPGDLLAYPPSGEAAASNLPPLYHGSAKPIKELMSGGGRSSENLFGPGFYATDNPTIAETYFRKGRTAFETPTLYSLRHGGTPKILDMEDVLPDAIKPRVTKWIEDTFRDLEYTPEHYENLLESVDRTGAQLYVDLKKTLRGVYPPMDAFEVDDILEGLNISVFHDAGGIDAFRYQGGVRIGKDQHEAFVFLRPEDVKIKPLERVQKLSGDNVKDAVRWLQSDAEDAILYRRDNGITADTISTYTQNLSNRIKAKTLSQDSLMAAIRDGEHIPGSPIYTVNDQGVAKLSPGFKNHINSLVEKGLTPDATIGEILEPVDQVANGILDRGVRTFMNKVLIGPINHWVTNPALRQYYYEELAHTLPLMEKSAQQAALAAAEEAGLRGSKLKDLRAVAASRSGSLSIEEGNLLTTGRASEKLHSTLYDMHDRKQVMDIMRLIFPFGQAWAQQLKEWASLLKDRPNIIPRAETLIHGAEGSGFFFTDPRSIQYDESGNPIPGTGTESFAYPGSSFVTKALTGAPFALTSPVASLNMFSQNPLMPGFGPIAQTVIGHILPDKPEFIDLKKLVAPFGSPDGLGDFLPSYMKKVQTAFSSPDSNRAFANTVWDTAKYLASTGQYDISTADGQMRLEDAARSMAKKIYLFRAIAQFALPSSPSPEDVVKDTNGQSVLTFKMAQDYYDLVDDDKLNHTNLAVSRFIDQYGVKNILGMQSITQGDQALNTKGFAWVLDHPDIARKYSDTYSYFAPAGGGRSQQAYDMLFEKGKRKILSVSDAMQLANARVASMIYDHLKEQLGPKRTPEQAKWLADRKELLIQKYPGWNPDYVGTKVPEKIRELESAAADPKLSSNPITPALQAYFHFRDQAEQSAGIAGWKTATSTRATRDWLRAKAAALTARVPEFQSVYDDLLSRELKDDG